jgi:hypothetical protein
LKQQFSWDHDEEDDVVPIIQPSETDVLPAEIPGVELEEDHAQVEAVHDLPGPTRAQLAASALANANLRSVNSAESEIAGVYDENLTAHWKCA